jgi:hypothetical protein
LCFTARFKHLVERHAGMLEHSAALVGELLAALATLEPPSIWQRPALHFISSGPDWGNTSAQRQLVFLPGNDAGDVEL